MKFPAHFCAIVTQAEITRIMGHAVPNVTSIMHTDCVSQPVNSMKTLVSFQMSAYPRCKIGQPASPKCLSFAAEAFSASKTFAKNLTYVSGVGDRAYCVDDDSPNDPPHELSVLKGWFILTTSADTCAHAQALASLILSRL